MIVRAGSLRQILARDRSNLLDFLRLIDNSGPYLPNNDCGEKSPVINHNPSQEVQIEIPR